MNIFNFVQLKMSALKRITRDYADMKKDPPGGISAAPIGDDLFHWEGCIAGPEDSPYAGGLFKLDIIFPEEYPFKPPKIKFLTKIFHPNISPTGAICLSTLKEDDWSPALKIAEILLSLVSLLTDPNPDDPLVPDIARLYKRDINQFNEQAKAWTLKYANS